MLKEQLLEVFGQIKVPEFDQDLVKLGWVRAIEIEGRKVRIDLVLPSFALKSERLCATAVKEAALLNLKLWIFFLFRRRTDLDNRQ